MSDYPGHPNDGNYDCPHYQRAVVIYFWTMLILGVVALITYVEFKS